VWRDRDQSHAGGTNPPIATVRPPRLLPDPEECDKSLLQSQSGWSIELFFKELKSTLGMDQYRFRKFKAVEGWMDLAVLTMLYLEWYRVQQLAQRNLSEAERTWWQRQRTHGLCQAIRQRSQQADLDFIAERLQTDGGTRKLKRLVTQSIPREYQCRS